ncbi:MAG: fatty acid desaturase CarF family protein, partial [Rariglobus sp.]
GSDILLPRRFTRLNPSILMSLLLLIPLIAVQVVLIVALADFVAGVVHWAEDAYFDEHTPVIGRHVIVPNIVHHHLPRYFTRLSWWESSAILVVGGAALLLIAWPLGLLSWQLGLFVAVGINANQIHKMAHRTRTENGWFISKLQDWRILQTPHHHGLHHKDPKNTFYCPITNFVNPLLEQVQFWPRLEAFIELRFGIKHRHDTAVRGQGPGPEWLVEFRPSAKQHVCTGQCRQCAQCRLLAHPEPERLAA